MHEVYPTPNHYKMEFSSSHSESWYKPTLVNNLLSTTYCPHRLPVVALAEFAQQADEHGITVTITVNGIRFGDQLSEASDVEDGYRFHDVIHLLSAICLGWSPITRWHLGLRRADVPWHVLHEDGLRAVIAEETISTLFFMHARPFLTNQKQYVQSKSLLNEIIGVTSIFESKVYGIEDWAFVTETGFELISMLRQTGGGFLEIDARSAALYFKTRSNWHTSL